MRVSNRTLSPLFAAALYKVPLFLVLLAAKTGETCYSRTYFHVLWQCHEIRFIRFFAWLHKWYLFYLKYLGLQRLFGSIAFWLYGKVRQFTPRVLHISVIIYCGERQRDQFDVAKCHTRRCEP